MSLTQIIAGSWGCGAPKGTRWNLPQPNAAVPFAAVLAREFGVTKGHVYRVLIGERQSPQRKPMLARQRQLLRQARKEAA